MKIKNIEASVYDAGNGEIQIWGVSFTIPGSLSRDVNGKITESARNKIIKRIKKVLSEIEIPNEEVHPNNN